MLCVLHPPAAGEGIEPVSFWYNPNIHPYQEYKARRDTLMAYAPAIGMKLIVREDYGLRDFCRAVRRHRPPVRPLLSYPPVGKRRAVCGEHGYASFTSTLFVSPYQNHELLRQTARRRQRHTGWSSCTRISVPDSGQASRRPGAWLYMQKYCGCVFSEGGPLPQAARPGSEESGKDH